MSTKQGFIQDKDGNNIIPNNNSGCVYDLARSQALSASLQSLTEKNVLGYPPFSTLVDYAKGEKVFYDRKLWEFNQAHAHGAWNSSHVTETSIEAIMEANLAVKAFIDGYYKQLTSGLSENLIDAKGNGTDQEVMFRRSSGDGYIADDSNAQAKKIKGRTVIWNQLYNPSDVELSHGTSVNNDGTININAEATNSARYIRIISGNEKFVNGHKYLLKTANYKNNAGCYFYPFQSSNSMQGSNYIIKQYGASGDTPYVRVVIFSNQSVNISNIKVMFVDLTRMFGAGKEPTTVAEFEALFPNAYYPYDAGSPLNVSPQNMVTNGFNQWDEEWELGGYDVTTGAKDSTTNKIRSKNAIAALPNTAYYVINGGGNNFTFCQYDANGTFIRSRQPVSGSGFTTESNCAFLRFHVASSYGTTYNHDICINLSDANRNGEYEAYWSNTRELGVLEAQSSGSVVFPDGLRGVGDVFDESTTKKGVVRFGKYVFTGSETTWVSNGTNQWNCKNILTGCASTGSAIICSRGDGVALTNGQSYPQGMNVVLPSSVTTAQEAATYMAGAIVYYQLATPQEKTYDEELNWTYRVANNGTESIEPKVDASGNPTTLPMPCVIKYNQDFTTELVNLPNDYVKRVDYDVDMEGKANVRGNYPELSVGAAKAIESKEDVVGSFFSRTSGGDAEISNGLAQIQGVGGNSVKVNQLLQNGNFSNGTDYWVYMRSSISVSNGICTVTPSVTNDTTGIQQASLKGIVENHKYLVVASLKGNTGEYMYFGGVCSETGFYASGSWERKKFIVTGTSTSSLRIMKASDANSRPFYLKYMNLLDLTAMGIDNLTTVAQVEEWLANNVGLQEYYDYNEGSVVNVTMTGVESIGRNLLDPTTNKAQILGAYDDTYGNYYGISGTSYGTLTFTNKLGVSTTITPDADGKFLLEEEGELSVATPSADCCVFLWWDGTKTDYVDYSKSVGNIDITHIWGKKNGAGDRVRVFPTGACGIGDLKDLLKLENDEVVAHRMIGEVDLGDLTWIKEGVSSSRAVFMGVIGDNKSSSNMICSKYIVKAPAYYNAGYDDKSIWADFTQSLYRVELWDSDYLNSTAEQFKTAIAGQMLYYELATPETYTDLVYMGSDLFADGTPVTLPVPYEVNNWGIENVLPKNTSTIVTAKPSVTCRYSLDIVEEVDTLETVVDNLDEKKADKVGSYPLMSVGSAKTLDGNNQVEAEINYRKTGSPNNVASGLATMNMLKGKSLVWNQLVKNGNFADGFSNWTTTYGGVAINNGILSISATIQAGAIQQSFTTIVGHKYYYKYWIKANSSLSIWFINMGGVTITGNTQTYWQNINGIITASSITDSVIFARFQNNSGTPFQVTNFCIIDLTLMFGEGNEPTSVAEFEKLYPLPYYAYNGGTIINNASTALQTVGFNQWDEEWEMGELDGSGNDREAAGKIRSKNYIPIFPNTDYYAKTAGACFVCFYDSNKVFTSSITPNNSTFTTPQNARFARFNKGTNYGTTYNHDICINISDPSRNGTYEPYQVNTLALNIPTMTGKKIVNGSTEGQESVTIFSDVVGEATVVGMKGVGTAYDFGQVDSDGYIRKVTKKFKFIDLGTLDYEIHGTVANLFTTPSLSGIKPVSSSSNYANAICEKYIVTNGQNITIIDKSFNIGTSANLYIKDTSYSSASTLKTAMNGVLLIAELATPEEYLLDTPILATFREDGNGTEMKVPQDASDSVTAPLCMVATYPIDAVSTLNNLTKNFVSKSSIEDLLSKLQAANIIASGWSVTYNATTDKLEYSGIAKAE